MRKKKHNKASLLLVLSPCDCPPSKTLCIASEVFSKLTIVLAVAVYCLSETNCATCGLIH